MSDEEFEEEDEEFAEPDLEEGDEEDDDEFGSPSLDDEDLLGDDSEDIGEHSDVDIDDEDPAAVVVVAAVVGREEEADEDDEGLDLEEELHPDDVEEPLDVLLLERTSGLSDEDDYDEDEDDVDADERAEPGSRIQPKRPGEFVCRSCFLVKHPSQLADAERVLCTDCT